MRLLSFLLVILLSGCSNFFGNIWGTIDPEEEPKLRVNAPTPPIGPGSTVPEDKPENTAKKRLLVLMPLNRTPYGGEQLAKEAEGALVEFSRRCGECEVMTAKDLSGSDQFAPNATLYNRRLILDSARMKGISAILFSSIESVTITESGDEIGILRAKTVDTEAQIRVVVVDAKTGRDLITEEKSATIQSQAIRLPNERTIQAEDTEKAKEAVVEAFSRALNNFAESSRRIDWRGKIVKSSFGKYYLNVGISSGLKIGHYLRVTGEPENIQNSDNGQLLGNARGPYKGTLRVIEFIGENGAIATLHSGAGMKDGDMVDFLPYQAKAQN